MRSAGGYAFAALAGLLTVLWAAFYAPLIPPLVREWYEHENFSYAFLIPLISIYLAFEERDRLKKIRIVPDIRGALLLGVALAVGVVGNALGEALISRVSLVVALVGVIWTVAGWAYVRVLGFAVAYLLLMVPPPYVIVKEISYYLKMFDAIVATGILQVIGVPVYRDSYLLNLPTITLEVADVCSGIASLFAMLALNTIYMYFLPTRIGAKFAVLIGGFIFPLIANLFRITLVGASVYYYGPIMLQAFFHRFTGTFTFMLSLVMLLLFGEFLRRRYPAREEKAFTKGYLRSESEGGQRVVGGFRSEIGFMPMATAGILLMFALYASRAMGLPPSIELRHDLAEVPLQIGRYHAAPELWPDPYTDPQAERVLSRLYEAPDQDGVEIFVGYRGSQYAAHRLSSPKLIFPKGWEYASMGNVHFRESEEDVDAVWLVTEKNRARRLVLFWYQLPGETYSSDVLHRLELARLLIFEGRTDDAVIRLATDLNGSESVDQALKRLINFSSQILPEIRRLLPEA